MASVSFRQRIRFVGKCEDGATAIEYGMIAALISVAIIGVLITVSSNMILMFSTLADNIAAAVN